MAELYEYAMQPEHISSINPHVYNTTISDTGALSVSSGQKTGRTPKEKRIVIDEATKNVIILTEDHKNDFKYRLYGGVMSTFQ